MTEQQDVHVHPVLTPLQPGRALLVTKSALTAAAGNISHGMALLFGCGHTSVEQRCVIIMSVKRSSSYYSFLL